MEASPSQKCLRIIKYGSISELEVSQNNQRDGSLSEPEVSHKILKDGSISKAEVPQNNQR
jgi:hypothetical protein